MTEKNAYRGYLICDSSDGKVFIQKGEALIGWAHDHEDAIMKIDAIVAPVSAPPKGRSVKLGLGGWTNPDSDKPCGPEDKTLQTFDPIHVGGCKGCRAVVVEMLKTRAPKPPKAAPVVQLELFER